MTDLQRSTLHVFVVYCLFYLGPDQVYHFLAASLGKRKAVKLTATRRDFLHNPRECQLTALPCWIEPAVINGPARLSLLQNGAKKGAAETRECFSI